MSDCHEVTVFALVGNPNSGKTSLFNALTGLRQKVGNYPGVTVERKEGIVYSQHGRKLSVIDLPGAYSLNVRSPDEEIMVDVLLGRRHDTPKPDAVLVTLDASNLERNLFLATQVMELGLPTILVLNMMDLAKARGMQIDTKGLSEQLGIPVIGCSARTGEGITAVRLAMSNIKPGTAANIELHYPDLLKKAVEAMVPLLRPRPGHDCLLRAEARLWLMRDYWDKEASPVSTKAKLEQQRFDRELPGWRSALITQRYAWIGNLMQNHVHRFDPNAPTLSQRLDAIVLHKVFGLGIFAGLMGLLFYAIFAFAELPMEWIDGAFAAAGDWVSEHMQAGDLRDLIVDGILGGVGAVVIFLPQILLLFFFIGLFESTGYMARAAFLLDRLMGKVGLHGRSFIPLLSSYACAVPGIMATRTIESSRDRLVTIFVAPFMTCSARLPVYLLMIGLLVAASGGGALMKAVILLGLYTLGTAAAFATALLIRRTVLRGEDAAMILELPPYRLPQVRHVFLEMGERAWIFLKRAGTLIFAFSILLWFSLNFPQPTESMDHQDPVAYSIAGRVGHAVEPVFQPLGYDWRISIGILSSMAAREVFVSSMAVIFRVSADEEDTATLVEALSIPTRPDGSQLFSMATTLSILVFFVFALQCISTVAIVRRETNSWVWAGGQFLFMFAVAYAAALLTFQIASRLLA